MMSSYRCRRNTPESKPRENGSVRSRCQNRNFVPGLLRLDSTGEVTSADQVSNCHRSTIHNEFPNLTEPTKCRSNNYRNIVENLTMGALFNSASACLGSAKSYIGSFCPYSKTSKGLVRSKGENSSFGYLQTMLDSKKNANLDRQSVHSVDPESDCRCQCAQTKKTTEVESPVKWTDSLFGAIQSSLLGNCQRSDKMRDVEKYVPPQRRCFQRVENNCSPVVDPKLTPYNARLLEKSKRSQSKSPASLNRSICDRKCANSNSPKLQRGRIGKSKQDPETVCQDQCKPVMLELNQMDCNRDLPNSIQNENVCSNAKTQGSDPEPDWFEYECDNAKCIPIQMEKIKVAHQKFTISDTSQGSDSKINQLHSWFSIENGNDNVSSADSTVNRKESSHVKKATEDSDKGIQSLQEEKAATKPERLNVIFHKSQDDNEQNSVILGSECHNQSRTDKAHQAEGNNAISVLYLRSLGKKQTRSAKRRRRQKAPSGDNNEQSATSSDESSSEKNSNSASRPTSAVAFILGYDGNNSGAHLPSFQVSCDMDCDSDWTESDCESDDNFSSLEEENMFGNELGFQCNDLLGNMQFKVTCTMQPNETSNKASSSSAIDNINTSWRVQVSVEPESPKTKSSKKVHFPDDNDLATIHPIIAWSHAYQAARKGPWEQYARDRGRFLRRITDAEKVLEPILIQNHRDKVFRERFEN